MGVGVRPNVPCPPLPVPLTIFDHLIDRAHALDQMENWGLSLLQVQLEGQQPPSLRSRRLTIMVKRWSNVVDQGGRSGWRFTQWRLTRAGRWRLIRAGQWRLTRTRHGPGRPVALWRLS